MPFFTNRGIIPLSSGAVGATFDPAAHSAHVSLSGGNLIASVAGTVSSGDVALATASHSSGKYYCEFSITEGSSPAANSLGVGLVDSSYVVGSAVYMGGSGSHGVGFYTAGTGLFNNANTGAIANPFTTGAIVGMAVDMALHRVWWTLDGSAWNFGGTGGDAVAGTNGLDISTMGATLFPAVDFENTTGGSITANFGGSAYAYFSGSPPSGYSSW